MFNSLNLNSLWCRLRLNTSSCNSWRRTLNDELHAKRHWDTHGSSRYGSYLNERISLRTHWSTSAWVRASNNLRRRTTSWNTRWSWVRFRVRAVSVQSWTRTHLTWVSTSTPRNDAFVTNPTTTINRRATPTSINHIMAKKPISSSLTKSSTKTLKMNQCSLIENKLHYMFSQW